MLPKKVIYKLFVWGTGEQGTSEGSEGSDWFQIPNWFQMSLSGLHNHLGSISYHSEPSVVFFFSFK
jgi:hypothetical protein